MESFLHVWEEKHLRDDFIQACNGIPPETCCCGFVKDTDKSVKEISGRLNKECVQSIEQIKNRSTKTGGFYIDTFVWSWANGYEEGGDKCTADTLLRELKS